LTPQVPPAPTPAAQRVRDIIAGGQATFDLETPVLYACGLALVTGILFGILPALQSARQDTALVLKSEAGGSAPHWGRSVLVTCRTALSLALLVGAGFC
jgi:ABC-type antimicrobial peptide transport system permease subunit